MWKEVALSYSSYNPDMYLEGQSKITKIMGLDSQGLGRGSNRASPEYNCDIINSETRCWIFS